MTRGRVLRTLICVGMLACSHSDSFVSPMPTAGPFNAGADVQLTFNADQDYWPTWSQDGRGILYAFVDAESAAPPYHRCLGILPAAGGTRIWELCDNRAVRIGTTSSYTAYALGDDGRLLVAEATAAANPELEQLPSTTLWLADTAAPYVRTKLLTLPQMVNGLNVTWLSDIAWTGPNTFIGLAQLFNSASHCKFCFCTPCPRDSIFSDGGMVVVGNITGATATLQAVAGTDSATSYSFAENGTSIVFTRHHDLHLFKVPAGGGTPVPAPVHRTLSDTNALITAELAGVSCKGETCVVAMDGIFLTDLYDGHYDAAGNYVDSPLFAHFLATPMQLLRVSLVDGGTQVLQSDSVVFAAPAISPTSGDVVVQRGGVWGHLQTFATAGRGNGHIHLLKGLIP